MVGRGELGLLRSVFEVADRTHAYLELANSLFVEAGGLNAIPCDDLIVQVSGKCRFE